MSIPKTCKGAVLVEFGKPLEIIDIEIPATGAGEILVKNHLSGICGSDVHQAEFGLSTSWYPLPMLMGHEGLGEIVELGEGRTVDINGEELHIGDRIMWTSYECGECYWCKSVKNGIFCADKVFYGFEHPSKLMGHFAEYTHITAPTQVVKVPEVLTDAEVVGCACAGRSVFRGLELLGQIHANDTVVVQGCGPIGLFATVAAHASLAGQIIVIGAPADRLELAKEWGATHTIDLDVYKDPEERKRMVYEWTNGRGAEIVIEASGFAPAFAEGVELCKMGGKYLMLGITNLNKIQFAPGLILSRCIDIIGSRAAFIENYDQALKFILKHRNDYPFEKLVTNQYRLEDINQALAGMKAGTEIKPVIDFSL